MKNVLLKTENLCVYFPIKKGVFSKITNIVKAVDNVNLEINSGEIVALVGESGSGKSTLGQAILGLEKITSGKLFYYEKEIAYNKLKFLKKNNINNSDSFKINRNIFQKYRRDFQIIFQDPYSSLNPRHTVFEIISEAILFNKIANTKNVKDKVVSALEKVGMGADHLYRYPHAFSGGQRQRLNIARVIALEPKLIICDEIVSALDLSVQAQIIELLLKLKKELNLSLLWISHDLSLVRIICDSVYVMYLGNLVESGPCVNIFNNPSHPYTQALISSIPSLDPNIKPYILSGEIPSIFNKPNECAFNTRCPKVQEKCKKEKPELTKIENKQVACFYPN